MVVTNDSLELHRGGSVCSSSHPTLPFSMCLPAHCVRGGKYDKPFDNSLYPGPFSLADVICYNIRPRLQLLREQQAYFIHRQIGVTNLRAEGDVLLIIRKCQWQERVVQRTRRALPHALEVVQCSGNHELMFKLDSFSHMNKDPTLGWSRPADCACSISRVIFSPSVFVS